MAPARMFWAGTPCVMSTIRASGFTVRMTPFMIPAKGSSNPKSVVSVMIEFGTKAKTHDRKVLEADCADERRLVSLE